MAMATQVLDNLNSNIVVDGQIDDYVDFGGTDAYTLAPQIDRDITINDSDESNVYRLPEGFAVDSATFTSNGLRLTTNAETEDEATITLLGSLDNDQFIFGGDPLQPDAGTALSFAELAAAMGASIPAEGEGVVEATKTGLIQADGTVSEQGAGTIDLTDQTEIAADPETAETFVYEFSSTTGNAESSDAQVVINGFDPAEDRLRLDDEAEPPVTNEEFMQLAQVVENGFDNNTKIFFQDDIDSDDRGAGFITLQGIQDKDLGGDNPFIEIV